MVKKNFNSHLVRLGEIDVLGCEGECDFYRARVKVGVASGKCEEKILKA